MGDNSDKVPGDECLGKRVAPPESGPPTQILSDFKSTNKMNSQAFKISSFVFDIVLGDDGGWVITCH